MLGIPNINVGTRTEVESFIPHTICANTTTPVQYDVHVCDSVSLNLCLYCSGSSPHFWHLLGALTVANEFAVQ